MREYLEMTGTGTNATVLLCFKYSTVNAVYNSLDSTEKTFSVKITANQCNDANVIISLV